ncbi:MAG: YbhB/YbcL family Raf kinase inhibitor-like protein [Planctomycetota bacterium]|jgi:Raf kinase inhibitor-like YbhB/YbcL family protein
MKTTVLAICLCVALVVVVVFLAGQPTGALDRSKGVAAMIVTSTAFADGKAIPRKYTGDGQDISPPIAWTKAPDGTKELALICDDPDAPRTLPWVHWVIYAIPASAHGLPEGIPAEQTPNDPAGSMQGVNSWAATGYRGPSPPKGHGVHHYHFKLYALDTALGLQPGMTKKALLTAMNGRILAEGELVGTYER